LTLSFLARITRITLFLFLPLNPGFRITKAHNLSEGRTQDLRFCYFALSGFHFFLISKSISYLILYSFHVPSAEACGWGTFFTFTHLKLKFEPREGPQYHLSELRGRREGVSFVGSF